MTLYLSGAGAYCAFLLLSKFSDRECSKIDPASWLVVAIASALWIIVIPLSLIEISIKAKAKAQLAQTRKSINPQTIKATEEIKEFDANSLAQINS